MSRKHPDGRLSWLTQSITSLLDGQTCVDFLFWGSDDGIYWALIFSPCVGQSLKTRITWRFTVARKEGLAAKQALVSALPQLLTMLISLANFDRGSGCNQEVNSRPGVLRSRKMIRSFEVSLAYQPGPRSQFICSSNEFSLIALLRPSGSNATWLISTRIGSWVFLPGCLPENLISRQVTLQTPARPGGWDFIDRALEDSQEATFMLASASVPNSLSRKNLPLRSRLRLSKTIFLFEADYDVCKIYLGHRPRQQKVILADSGIIQHLNFLSRL